MEIPDEEMAVSIEHPLKNAVILKQLFDFLQTSASFQDWRNIRLVCKLWYDQTLSRWRNNAVLCLVNETPTFETPSTNKATPSEILAEFQNPQSSYKLSEFPYRKYKLENLAIHLQHCDEDPVASSFWNLVGPTIHHITCTNVNFKGHFVSTNTLLQFFMDKMPNLTSLNLDKILTQGNDFYWPEAYLEQVFYPKLTVLHCTDRIGFWMSSFPNLQEFKFCNGKVEEFIHLLVPSRDALIQNPGPFIHSSIKNLDLINCSNPYFPTVIHIGKIRFPALEHFSILVNSCRDHQYTENDSRFLPTFLKNHSEHLKTLEIFSWIAYDPKSQHCPLSIQWPVLSELLLWGNVVPDLGFLRFTPNLTLLHMDLYGFEHRDKMMDQLQNQVVRGRRQPAEDLFLVEDDMVKSTYDMGTLATVVLEKLEYFQINCPLLPETMRYLAELMPNLKTFKAVLDDTTLPKVCKKWPKLERLACLFGSSIKDENVIGGLVDLKYLKSFQYDTDCGMSTLTDLSIAKGFLQMRELTDVRLCVSKKVTKDAEELLKSRIQNVILYRNYKDNSNHENWKCCKNKMYNYYIKHYQPLDMLERHPPSPDNFETDEEN